MAIRLKPKHFGPLNLKTEGQGSFTYNTDAGYKARTGAPASTEIASPSDLIMAALASCIGVSLEIAAKKLKIEPGEIDIAINASKALDLPSRFGHFTAVVHLEKISDEDLATRLLKEAKEMCTVSNTLNAEVSVSLR
jgi:uncharacterized OsmC-like protein